MRTMNVPTVRDPQ